MAVGLNKTKRRIASIEATEKTTKAMGLIAMVKLKRFLTSFESQSLYSKEYLDVMSHLFAYDKEPRSPYSAINEKAKGSLYIVITSDLGLCGAYNSSIFKAVNASLGENDVLAPIGRKGINHYKAIGYENLDLSYSEGDLTNSEYLSKIAKRLKKEFDEGKYREIKIIYTHYINSLRAEPAEFRLLPVSTIVSEWPDEKSIKPEFDGDTKELIESLMPGYLTSQIYDRVIESSLSEQSTRRNAMDNANDNADELLEKLRIEYNKARQSAITQEITEVVGGASADE